MNGIVTGLLVCAIIFTKTDQTNGQTIDGLSNMNSTAGKNISITWLMKNIQNPLVITVYINSATNANKLASFTTTNVETSEEISLSSPSIDVIKRARLYYTYIGEFHGNKTGRITLEISKLKLTDTNGYILEFTLDHDNTFTTMLNINYHTSSQTIYGQTSVNSPADKNITITWLMKNIRNPLVITVYINSATNENKLASFTTTNVETSEEISLSSSSFDVIKRARLYYTYAGKLHGIKTGRITLEISKLKLTDTNGYILEFTLDHDNTFTTMLNINYGAKRCGAGLKPEYLVTGKEKLIVTMDICSKPQPRVTCTLAGQSNKVTANITSINAANNYTFTASISTDMDACDKKQLQCIASGVAGQFRQTALVVKQCKKTRTSEKTRCIGYIGGYTVSGIFLIGIAAFLWFTRFGGKKRKQTLLFSICLGLIFFYLVGFSGVYSALRPVDTESCNVIGILLAILLAITNILVFIVCVVLIIRNMKQERRYPETTDGDNQGVEIPLNVAS